MISQSELKSIGVANYPIFREIGQILKAYVEEKIAEDIYLIRFLKNFLFVQSKIELKKGKYIFLKVESLRPKVVLKQLNTEGLKPLSKKDPVNLTYKPSLWKLIKTVYKSDPELKSIIQIILNPKKIEEKLYWENIKKLFFGKHSRYFSFIKFINSYTNGLYLQLPYFYSIKDIEIYFEKEKGSDLKDKKYTVHLGLKLSILGPVNIIIEQKNKFMRINFRVKEKYTHDLINNFAYMLENKLKSRYPSMNIDIDCVIMPEKYWERDFCLNITNQDKGFVDIIV